MRSSTNQELLPQKAKTNCNQPLYGIPWGDSSRTHTHQSSTAVIWYATAVAPFYVRIPNLVAGPQRSFAFAKALKWGYLQYNNKNTKVLVYVRSENFKFELVGDACPLSPIIPLRLAVRVVVLLFPTLCYIVFFSTPLSPRRSQGLGKSFILLSRPSAVFLGALRIQIGIYICTQKQQYHVFRYSVYYTYDTTVFGTWYLVYSTCILYHGIRYLVLAYFVIPRYSVLVYYTRYDTTIYSAPRMVRT